MKKLLFIITIFFIINLTYIPSFSYIDGDTQIDFYLDDGCSLQWNGLCDESEIYCFPNGQGCCITVTIINIGIPVLDDGDLWRTSVRFGSIEHHISSGACSGNGVISRSANNYVFPQGSSLKITSCKTFPQINNSIIDISGKQTNSEGWLDIQIHL